MDKPYRVTANRFRRITAAIGLLLATVSVSALAIEPRDLVFRVLLDDDEIGFHRFSISNDQGLETIDIAADLEITFLAIPVYSYDHRNREVWRDGCLQQIESRTDDNGDDYRVDGSRQAQGFRLESQQGVEALEAACVMTFAYWNPAFLQQTQLLNSQTGEYLPIRIESRGEKALELGEQTVDAQGYRLINEDEEIDITVWYTLDSDRWLSLESIVAGGRILRYVPAEIEMASTAPADREERK